MVVIVVVMKVAMILRRRKRRGVRVAEGTNDASRRESLRAFRFARSGRARDF